MRAGPRQVNIQFKVEPGRRARFASPVITGDLKLPPSKLVGRTGWKGWFGWQPVTEARAQSGPQRILQSYRKQDYLMAQRDSGHDRLRRGHRQGHPQA